MTKFNVSNRLIFTASLMLFILVLNIVSFFILINKKNKIEDALNISQQTREQLLKADKVNESLLLVENSFHEYYTAFDPDIFDTYKKQINDLAENIKILTHAVLRDTISSNKNISKILNDKERESEIYLKLRAITDSLIFSVNVLDEKKEELSHIPKGSLNIKIDTISVIETKTDTKKGLLGKIKSALVGEEVEQNTNTKISVHASDEVNILEQEILNSPDNYDTASNLSKVPETNKLATKTRELKNSGLRLIMINRNLIAEISKLTDDIESEIKNQEATNFDIFISSVKASARNLQNISITLVAFALILSIYIVKLAMENDKSQKRIIDLNRKVKHQSGQKDKFLSIISHDLLNPFNALLGFSEMLNEVADKGDREEIVEYSSVIHDTSVRILSLLENLLIWARTQNGKIKYSPSTVEVEGFISQIVNILNPIADNKKIDLSWNVDKVDARFDENMISSVIQNLVTNAIKFTNREGKVTIRVWTETDVLNFAVSDTGIGMSQEQVDKLFRIEAIHSGVGTEDEPGTGLGLAIAKEFVEQHGGRIWVESTLGKGSQFYVSIPQEGRNSFE